MRVPTDAFDGVIGAPDPAATSRAAHESAAALLHRVRRGVDADVVERLIAYTDREGLEEVAQMWSAAPARSLPGALWRLYAIRAAVRADPAGTAWRYERAVSLEAVPASGQAPAGSVHGALAGAPPLAGPDEMTDLIDQIMRGVFTGDFEIALERAASFAWMLSRGAIDDAVGAEGMNESRAEFETRRAARLLEYSEDLHASARLWARGALD